MGTVKSPRSGLSPEGEKKRKQVLKAWDEHMKKRVEKRFGPVVEEPELNFVGVLWRLVPYLLLLGLVMWIVWGV